jgi:hypothetical protein
VTPVASTLARQVRRTGGRLVRRWGLLPAGDPDGLGDDDALRGARLPFTVMLYFPDTTRNLYQLRQWYRPLRELDRSHRVGVVCLDSRSAAAVRGESGLPVVCCGRIGTLEELVARSDIALALYVNHNIRNFHPLRFPTMLHAYLGHGESDKAASASNQVKAYDAVLVAGEVGRERLARNLLGYQADRHVRLIGRPQLDGIAPRRATAPSGRTTVLYAPTWEGAQPSMAYGSVRSHGSALLRSLLREDDLTVVYRPHPRSGANRADYGEADRALRALVERHAAADPAAGHRVDLSPDWDVLADPADLLVCDVSAVASDWMTTGRPIVVTVPASPDAFLDADSVLDVAANLPADAADRTAALVREQLGADVSAARTEWLRRTLGDTSPGAATAAFVTTCAELVAERGRELAARAARRRGDG